MKLKPLLLTFISNINIFIYTFTKRCPKIFLTNRGLDPSKQNSQDSLVACNFAKEVDCNCYRSALMEVLGKNWDVKIQGPKWLV